MAIRNLNGVPWQECKLKALEGSLLRQPREVVCVDNFNLSITAPMNTPTSKLSCPGQLQVAVEWRVKLVGSPPQQHRQGQPQRNTFSLASHRTYKFHIVNSLAAHSASIRTGKQARTSSTTKLGMFANLPGTSQPHSGAPLHLVVYATGLPCTSWYTYWCTSYCTSACTSTTDSVQVPKSAWLQRWLKAATRYPWGRRVPSVSWGWG